MELSSVILVITFIIPLFGKADLQDYDPAAEIKRGFQPIDHCYKLEGEAHKQCVDTAVKKGMEECHSFLKEQHIVENMIYGNETKFRYNCAVVDFD